MKTFKKIMALVIAMVMVLSLSFATYAQSDVDPDPDPAPAATTATVTITKGANDTAEHTYEAYKVFSGVVDGDQLTKIEWGDGVKSADLMAALDSAFGTSTSTTNKVKTPAAGATAAVYYTLGEVFAAAKEVGTAAAYAEAIGFITGATDLETLSDTVGANLSDATTGTGSDTGVAGLAPGYYLIKDEDDSLEGKEDGAYTKFILKMLGADVTVKEKAEVPKVDKQVQDETADAEEGHTDGYGDSADHDINESFNFKVIATIPKDVKMANYDTYLAKFTDTMSAGVTFEEISSVTVNSHTVAAYAADTNANGYKLAGVAKGDAGKTFTIELSDLKKIVSADEMNADITITVIYKAHLNENAVIRDASGEAVTDNSNKVKLTYSNNADAYGDGDTGDTPEDTVWVFTYKAENTKYADDESKVLPDAGFTLYDSTGAAVNLFWDSTKSAYRPVAEGETAITEMKSQSDGTFNIIGLDAGTYTLKETTVPTGYNAVDDITVKIESTHKENTAGTGADVTMTKTNTNNKIIDKSGTVLPETGGIGTTIFYVVGAILVLGAGIILVIKRRMSAN